MNREDTFVNDGMEIWRVQREIFKNLHSFSGIEEEIVYVCGFCDVRKNWYFGEDIIGRVG